MTSLSTTEDISNIQAVPDTSSNVLDAKSSGDRTILVTSTEITTPSLSESQSDNDAESVTLSEKRIPEQVQLATAANVAVDEATAVPQAEVFTAIKVLQVIEEYAASGESWPGLADYVPLVTEQIRAGEPVQLLFTGFGFKSPAAGEVLGELPDLGEKLALGHLDGLCSNIARVYEKGAEIHICCNGLVYNDLLGISDGTVWEYSHQLQMLAKSSNFQHVRFIRLSNLLDHPALWLKDYAIAHASCARRELLYRYAPAVQSNTGDETVRELVKQYIPSQDQTASSDLVSSLSARWGAFASALKDKKSRHIPLSSQSFGATGQKNTLEISLLPQNGASKSLAPWQSCIAIELDGRYRTARTSELQSDPAYELVLGSTGSPSHYRAKSDVWNWNENELDVSFEHLYPTGTIIRPNSSSTGTVPSIQALPMRKVRVLSQRFSPIVLRGFAETTNEEYFLSKGNELGDILTWTFGQILKVKDSGEVDKNANNVTSNEAMPMHFDGIFKFVDTTDPVTGVVKKVLTPPRYQYFTCLSTAPKGDGYTLFANSRLFFQHLPKPFSLERLEKATWSMVNDGFWSAKQTELPLVVRHKETGAACLRWHEPWTKTKFSKYFIEIENDEAGEELVSVINSLLYDYRICLRFEWEEGDLLINDNVSMLHTRTAFSGNCEREMWRIHFD